MFSNQLAQFEARLQAKDELYRSFVNAPGIRDVLSGSLQEWTCRTAALEDLHVWALERSLQIARYCVVRKRLRGVTITPVRMEAYHPNRRRLRVYALAPFQKRSRWLEGVDIPGIEWY